MAARTGSRTSSHAVSARWVAMVSALVVGLMAAVAAIEALVHVVT